MAIKAIIWDVGGVLERTEDFGPRQQLAEELGWSMEDLTDLFFGHNTGCRAQLGTITDDQHWEEIKESLHLDSAEMQEAVERFFGGDLLDTELVAYIRELKGAYTTAILSNYGSLLREKLNHRWQIADAFDHVIVSCEVGVMKPDPAIYQIVLEKVSCKPEEAVFIDDSLENVEGARNVGMHAIHFKSPQQVRADLGQLLAR